MRILGWSLLGLFVVIVILAWTYVESKLYVKRERSNDRIIVEVKALFGIVRYRTDVPFVQFAGWCKGVVVRSEQFNETAKKTPDSDTNEIDRMTVLRYWRNTKRLIRYTEGLNDWIQQVLSRIECTNWSWNTRIGMQDAPTTALAVGVVWGVKSTLVGFSNRFIRMRKPPNIAVVPQYNSLDFSTELLVVGRIRIVHVVTAAVSLMMRIGREKGGFKMWRQILFQPKET